jgi:hypothetical protein
MRSLAQPEVLRNAAIASAVTATLCYPRLALWSNRLYPIWYLEAVLLLGGTVLWAFVFAWHAKYTSRAVFIWKIEPVPFAVATGAGLAVAALLKIFGDPQLRAKNPEEYPQDVEQWIAMTLFSLAFTQLFLVFAPFAWLIRLLRRRAVGAVMTAVFGMVVLWIKNDASKHPFPPPMMAGILGVRLVVGLFSVYLFLRGGVLLVWWWELLVQGRNLFGMSTTSQ